MSLLAHLPSLPLGRLSTFPGYHVRAQAAFILILRRVQSDHRFFGVLFPCWPEARNAYQKQAAHLGTPG